MKNSSEIGHDLNFSRYLLNRTWRLVPLVLLPLVVATFVFSGGGKITGDIKGIDYQRLYYHVLPVVLSAEFLGHPYDHTADNLVRQIVWSQPLDQSINLTIKKSIEEIKKISPSQDRYYWMVDDRGFADFAFVAFKLFGFEMASLSKLWFVLLAIFTIFLTITAWNKPKFLLFNVLYLTALIVSVGLFQKTNIGDDPRYPMLHLTESRFFELLAIPVLLAGLSTLDCRNKKLVSLYSIFIGASFYFLSSIRSTCKVYFYALIIGVVVKLIINWKSRIYKKSSNALLYLTLFLATITYLSLTFLGHQIESEKYESIGKRTVFHNALMGFAYSTNIGGRYGISVSDHDALAFVIALRETDDLDQAANLKRLDQVNFRARAQIALSWDPGTFDWEEYERDARITFFRIIRENPKSSLQLFLVEKPRALINQVIDKTSGSLDSRFPPIQQQLLMMAIFVFGVSVLWRGRQASALFAQAISLLLVCLGSLQSILFYPGVTQMGVLIVSISTFILSSAVSIGFLCRNKVRGFSGDTIFNGNFNTKDDEST